MVVVVVGLLITSWWWGSRRRVGFGGVGQLNEYKSGDQPVTECWTASFEDLTPFIIFACCICSQFTEPKGSAGAERPLTLSLRGAWPEAEPTCLFTACFMFVLYYYGPSWIGCSHRNRIPLVIEKAHSIECNLCTSLFTHWFDTTCAWLFSDKRLKWSRQVAEKLC